MNKKFKSIVLQEFYLFHAKLSFNMPNWNLKRNKLGGYLIVGGNQKRRQHINEN